MAKRSPEEILKAIEEAPLDDEADRVLTMTPEERRAELEAAGVDMAKVHAQADALHEKLSPPAPRVRRRSPIVWLAAAALCALLGVVGAFEGRAVVAWLKGTPEPILPDNERAPPPPPHEIAEKMRDEADKACADHLWGRCTGKLDEASKIDPAGESGERVQRMRQEIRDGTTRRPGPPEKPGGR
jgi:hypothetical protein